MRQLLVSATFAALVCSAHAQVPTTDAAAIAQMVQQIQKLQSLEDKFKGDRGLWNFLNSATDQELAKHIPKGIADVLKPSGGQLDRDIANILRGVPDRKTVSAGESEKLRRTAAGAATANSTFDVAAKRAENIQRILDRAGDPNLDVKGLDELRLRMQAESALIQADQVRLQALNTAREAFEQIELEKKNANFYNSLRKPAVKTPAK